MSFLTDTLALYGRVFTRGARLFAMNWWLAVVAGAFQALLLVVALTAAKLGIGILGGLLVTVAMAGCVSSWFVLIGQVVRYERASVRDVAGSFTTYLGDWLTFGFLLWALRYVAAMALADVAYLAIVFDLAVIVFLSAVPEQIYLGHEAGAAVFVGSYRFVGTYWIEWLPANAVLAMLLVAGGLVPILPLSTLLVGVAAAFASIVRGLLFLELTTSSRRARDFQRRAAG